MCFLLKKILYLYYYYNNMDELDDQIKKIKINRMSPDERLLFNMTKNLRRLKSDKKIVYITKQNDVLFKYNITENEMFYNESLLSKYLGINLYFFNNYDLKECIRTCIRKHINFPEYNNETKIEGIIIWDKFL